MIDDEKDQIKDEIASIVGDDPDPDEITFVKVKMKPKEEKTPTKVVVIKNHVEVHPPKEEKEEIEPRKTVKVVNKKPNKENTFQTIVEQRVHDGAPIFKRKGITLL